MTLEQILIKEKFKDTKGVSEAINPRMVNNTEAKRIRGWGYGG